MLAALVAAAAPVTWPPAAEPVVVRVDGAGGPVDLKAALLAAAATYNAVAGSGLRFAVIDQPPGGGLRDGRTTASWGTLDPSLYAVTHTWLDAAGGIAEIDVVFRVDACWTPGLPDGWPVGSGGCPVDLETVALHELGHAAGYVHTTSGLEEPSVMEGAIHKVRRDLEDKDHAALARDYPPRLVVVPDPPGAIGLGQGGEAVVLAGALGLIGWPASLEGLTVRSTAGPPLAEVRLEHVSAAGRTVLGSSADQQGPWEFAFAPITPTASDRLEVVARRPVAAPLALFGVLGLALVAGRRRRALALVLALAACGGGGGGGGQGAAVGWRFEVAAEDLVVAGDGAIAGGAWVGPAVDPTP